MSNFYSNFVYIGCPRGCNAKMQALLFDENENPVDVDEPNLLAIYTAHNAVCSNETPYIDHADAYYGDSEACYVEPCEY